MLASYPVPPSNPDFPLIEREILDFWKENRVFERSVEIRPAQDGSFVFNDGPPFANGMPHYGHLLTGYVKDLFARYQTMQGKRIERRFGWDCHGLPAEMAAEKDLAISGRTDILDFGIDKFNAYCQSSVMRYTHEWERYVTRQARWVDFANDYKTMDTGFMESVLWAFKELYKKDLLYEAYRVMPYSWGAETPLSNFETRLDNAYRDRTDKAVTVAFELTGKPSGAPDAKRYLVLAWTTTPWTLPSNLALAVSREQHYAAVMKGEDCYLLADWAVDAYKKELGGLHVQDQQEAGLNIAARLPGEALLEQFYLPLFPYFASHPDSFRILDGTHFIEAGSGTGIVHMAPGFGEEDQKICEEAGINIVCPVDTAGRFTAEIFDLPDLKLQGLNVLAAAAKDDSEPYSESQLEKYGLVNLRIAGWLKERGALIRQEDYTHSYPHCWRTDTPLIYRAMPSWYVEVTKFKDRMVALNQQINWIPSHVKDGLFGKWLENARDWSISRNRFWGCPIPVWKSDNPHNKTPYVFGSIKELQDFFGVEVKDLHRPMIDELTAPDPTDPHYTLRRIEDVFDCWFESGSMPFAQNHFMGETPVPPRYPADFIVEYTAQTRGWFYTMHVLGTALFGETSGQPAFLNCICHGVVIDEDGEKLSKRKANYPDPLVVFDQFGADALRWFMMSSAIMRGAELQIDREGSFIRDAVRLYIKPLWNAYHFFCLYADADKVTASFRTDSPNVMDRYILAKLQATLKDVRTAFDAYDTPGACQSVTQFLDALTNWYIRRNRVRFWKGELDADKQAAYDTLYTVLHALTRAVAPLLPLVSESIFAGLTQGGRLVDEGSIHLQRFPVELLEADSDTGAILTDMERVRDICNAAHAIRNQENMRVRQPLKSLQIREHGFDNSNEFLIDILKDEINVKEIIFNADIYHAITWDWKLNFPVAGKRLGEEIKKAAAGMKKFETNIEGGVSNGIQLLSGEFSKTVRVLKPGGGALPGNGAIYLDLTLDSELIAEGVARDVVRLIQQSRKDAGLSVSDRVRLVIDAEMDAWKAAEGNLAYIKEQVLAEEITPGDANHSAYVGRHELDGKPIAIGVDKVAV